MTTGSSKRVLRLIMNACGAIFIVSFVFVTFVLVYYYAYTRSTVNDVAAGRIYPLDIHGWVVYLNRGERLFLDVCASIAVVCGIAAAAMKAWIFPD